MTDPAERDAVVNWAEVAWAGLDRIRHELDRAPLDVEHLADLFEAFALPMTTR